MDPVRDRLSSSFFDFDDGGTSYLAYDLAVYLWANAFLQRELAMWHAFIDGYRSIRSIPATDFDALHLFVPIRHIWLMVNMRAVLPRRRRCPLNGCQASGPLACVGG